MYLPFGSFTLFFLIHFVVWRVLSSKTRGIMLLFFLSILSLIPFLYFSDEILYLIAGHAFLIMLYMHFYVGMDRSVSIRVLGELYKSQMNELIIDDLNQRYSVKYMFDHRLKTLIDNRWIFKINDVFICNAKGRVLAIITLKLRNIYKLIVTG